MSTPIVRVDGVIKRFGEVTAVDRVDLEIDVVDGSDRAEAFGQAFNPDDGSAHRPVFTVVQSRVRSRVCSGVPAVMV